MTQVRLMDRGEYLCQTSTHPPQHILTRLEVVGESINKCSSIRQMSPRNINRLRARAESKEIYKGDSKEN